MDDLGAPVAYLALEPGVPVYARGGESIGTVDHVLADASSDIFDGLIIDMRLGPGGHRFVDAPHVSDMHERGVVLALDATEAERLPEPSANPAVLETDAADLDESALTDKLRRAWDWISGRY
jgi:uncharacterized protein YrrD